MSRNLERSTARALYAKFAKQWRQQKRAVGVYGEPGYARPKFSQWFQMHQQNLAENGKRLGQVQQELHAEGTELADPWFEDPPMGDSEVKEERGVVTMNISGDD